MTETPLFEICRPKQWKTISSKDLSETGYPVYGANGIIGFHSEYNHEKPTILITCRGATCGTINVSLPYSYINGNAMALDDLDETKANLGYISYFLKYRGLTDVISGSAQPQITREGLQSVKIPLPPLEEQRRIAAILDKADELRQKRQQVIEKLDQLLQSTFIDMFGDPVSNPKGWKKVPVGDVTTCIVPGRDKPKKFSGNIPWITTDDLIPLGYTSVSKKHTGLTEYEIEEVRAKIIPSNSVVMSCVGNLGLTSIAINPFVMNQQLHGFQCTENLTPEFLMFYLPFEKNYMLSRATSTTLPYMNKSVCNSIPIILPDINLQEKWTNLFIKVEDQKQKLYKQLEIQDNLFKSLQNQAFSGNF